MLTQDGPPYAGHTRVQLPGGTLDLEVERSAYPLHELLDFAARRNPRRGFLFVSRVLGKHLPVTPEVAALSWQQLAAQLPPLERPHFIGLAETATALGEGVCRAWEQRSGRAASYQHTTRYLTGHYLTGHSPTHHAAEGGPLLRFDEPHSHAPAHLLYDPGEAARSARELVLVDDELSTGTTLENLARAWRALHPQLRRVVLVSLTDWCGRRSQLEAALGLPVHFVSLLRGRYTFTPDPRWQPPALPPVVGRGDDKTRLLPAHSARYGDRPELDGTLELDGILEHLQPTDRLLVLGSGEFQYPAYALAARAAPLVADCRWSATTRSPVLPGLAVRHHLSFPDSVSDGIPNFLYNVDPAEYTRILVGYEGACLPPAELLRQLGPQATPVQLA